MFGKLKDRLLRNTKLRAALTGANPDFDVVTNLVKSGASPKFRTRFGEPLIQIACLFDKIELVELLIESGCPVDQMDKKGNTALFASAMRGNVKLINILLDAGANIDSENEVGENAIDIAEAHDQLDAVWLLSDRGAEEKIDHKMNRDFEFFVGDDGHINRLWLRTSELATDKAYLEVLITQNLDDFPKDVSLAAFINVREGYYTVNQETDDRGGVYLNFGD